MFVRSLPTHFYGGMEQHTWDLCRELAKKHEVTVLTTGILVKAKGHDMLHDMREAVHLPKTIIDAANIHFLGPDTGGRLNGGYFKRSVEKFHEIARDNPFDIVHSQGTAAWGYAKTRDDYSPPLVNTPHGTHLNEVRSILSQKLSMKSMVKIPYYIYHYMNRGRKLLQKSDAVIAISDELFLRIPKEYGIPQQKVRLIYNGIDTDYFKPMNLSKTPYKKTILYMGQLVEQKGVQHLLTAVKRLQENHELKLKVIGDGDYKTELMRRAFIDLRLSDTEFLGRIKRENLRTHIDLADIVVFPTMRWEGMPLAVIEAMACEKPVIASKIGGIPSIIDDGIDGVLTPPGNADALAEAMGDVLDNQMLTRQMAKSARRKAVRKFSLKKMVDKTEKLYKELIQ